VVPPFENSKPFACSRAQDSNKGWSNIAEMGETNVRGRFLLIRSLIPSQPEKKSLILFGRKRKRMTDTIR
jgi:hypothetical protein